MGDVLRFSLLGLGTGSLYVLVATGMVLIYRGSGVVNFAQGAMGMVGTYVWWELHHNSDVSFALALALGLAASGVIGVLVHLLIMRPLGDTSGLTKVIATLGVMVVLQGAAALRYPSQVTVVQSSLPTDSVDVLGQALGQDQLLIMAIVTALMCVCWAVYKYTGFGLATSAVAENPRSAGALGISPDLVAAANWGIGAMLAALAGILIAPISGLQVAGLTLLVVPSLTGAMVGGLTSFPLTMAGGLALGIAQSLAVRYVRTPGWGGAIPFIFIFVILVVRGRAIPVRGAIAARLPSVGTGHIRPIVVAVSAALTYLAVWHWFDYRWDDAAVIQAAYAIILLSVVVLTGYAGQLSLAQMSFAGVGTLVAARLVSEAGVPFELAIVIACLAGVPLGVLVGLAGVRTRGVSLAIVTLLMAVAIESVLFGNSTFLGGQSVTKVGQQTFFGIDIGAIVHPQRYAMFAVGILVVAGVAVANLRRGRVGRRLLAVRGNERAAAALGIGVPGAKLYAFALSSVIAALGGIVLSFRNSNIGYDGFGSIASIAIVQNAVVGSVGWIAGAPLGAALYSGAGGSTAFGYLGDGFDKYVHLIGGALLLVTLIFGRDGLAAMYWHSLAPIRRLLFRSPKEPDLASVVDHTGDDVEFEPRILQIKDVSVRFGGVVALDSVSLDVRAGEVVGLIGPNGAGKTTLIDAVTGFVSATGSILLDEHELNGRPIAKRQHLGVSRSFQSLELFDDMTVLDNLRVASDPTQLHHYVTDLVVPGRPPLNSAAHAAINEFGLHDVLSAYPRDISYGQRRLVAIARAVAAAPPILLLDEPAAGLDEQETRELGDLVRRLSRERGIGVLMIEHHVEMVLAHCDRIYVLQFGTIIASGTPDEIRRDPLVVEAYLGAPIEPASAEPGVLLGVAATSNPD